MTTARVKSSGESGYYVKVVREKEAVNGGGVLDKESYLEPGKMDGAEVESYRLFRRAVFNRTYCFRAYFRCMENSKIVFRDVGRRNHHSTSS